MKVFKIIFSELFKIIKDVLLVLIENVESFKKMYSMVCRVEDEYINLASNKKRQHAIDMFNSANNNKEYLSTITKNLLLEFAVAKLES